MFESMTRIELSGMTYPLRCDMAVLEQIQDEFGSIETFENKILTWEYMMDEEGNKITKPAEKEGEEDTVMIQTKTPDIKTVNKAFFLMANEGLEFTGESPFKTVREAARMIDIPLNEIAKILHAEFMRCFKRKNQ